MKLRIFIIVLSLLIIAVLALVAYSLMGNLSPPDQEIIITIPADGN